MTRSSHSTVTGSLKQFFDGEIDKAKIPPIYQPLVDGLKVKSVIDVPLVVRERGIGELMLASHRPNFFNQGDAVTAATAAGQLASAIEQSTLSSQTDESLRQRIDQLTALTRTSREITNTLDLNTVMRRVYDELLRTTRRRLRHPAALRIGRGYSSATSHCPASGRPTW